jgi:outer membrane protein assembly factor BamD (BamD/ComL family)
MTFSDTRRQAALFVLLIAVGAAATARAADDDTTPVSVLIGDAVAEYEAGHYQEARALFRQAHEKQPTARTLRGIGMASFELRDYV